MNRGNQIIAPIEGRIAASDLRLPARDWSLQESPNTYEVRAGDSYIRLRKFPYPETFVRLSNDKIVCGYKDPGLDVNALNASLDSEFLIFEIDLKAKLLRIKADALTSLPVCYCAADGVFYFSYNVVELLKLSGAPIEYNMPALAEFLLLKTRYNNQSIVQNVYYLMERETIEWNSNHEVKSVVPPNRFKIAIREIDDKAAVAEFGRLLDRAVKRKLALMKDVKVCTELSGGLDSAIVTQALISANVSQPLSTFSKILPGDQKKHQIERLKAFANTFGCELNFIDLSDKYPLANLSSVSLVTEAFDPTLEPYRLGVVETAHQVLQKGCRVIFTGMGGDELLERCVTQDSGFQGKLEEDIRKRWAIPQFFTKQILNAFFDKKNVYQSQRVPFFAHSVVQGPQVRSPFFLERGIWPVSVLADSELVNFCRSLPNRFLKRKEIIRMYQQQSGFPGSFYNVVAKDSMYPLHRLGLESNPDLIYGLFEKSRLAGLGLLDKDKLIDAYRRYLKEIKSEGRIREYFYEVVANEIFLRSMEQYEHRKKTTVWTSTRRETGKTRG